MVAVGIEAMNVFGGSAALDVSELARRRGLDRSRFANLMMVQKSVALPFEDPITFGVNAAAPLVDSLSEEDKGRIELLITCSESGIDFGKSISTYIHHHLGLSRCCRMFELKQACYAATAGLQMALGFILSQASPGAKALVVATDISRFLVTTGGDALTEDWSYFEPSAGAGSVALLVSDVPDAFAVDVGASGYHGYEVMDTCRPVPDSESGDIDLSLMSYLDCCEKTFLEYQRRVANADYRSTFGYLAFHTPFGGMVKGAHRMMMRKLARASREDIEVDFERRVAPGLRYCQRVGNIMGGTVFLSLASTIDHGDFARPVRIGCFSYGSGCCSEFYSGTVTARAQQQQRRFGIEAGLDRRYRLSFEEYEDLLLDSQKVRFGTRNVILDPAANPGVRAAWAGTRLLALHEIREFHRRYEWVS